VTVRIVGRVRALPTTGMPVAATAGGALLVDLRSVNRVLEQRYGESVTPTEWWLRTAPGAAARVAAELRARPDVEPSQVVVRDEIAQRLRDDPFGAGPEAAFAAASVVAAALAAVGFAVSTAGSLRARSAEFACCARWARRAASSPGWSPPSRACWWRWRWWWAWRWGRC
jgi:hypothetical protein